MGPSGAWGKVPHSELASHAPVARRPQHAYPRSRDRSDRSRDPPNPVFVTGAEVASWTFNCAAQLAEF